MTLEEAASKIGEIFNGMIYVIKNVPDELISITPQKNGEGETVRYPNLSTEEE